MREVAKSSVLLSNSSVGPGRPRGIATSVGINAAIVGGLSAVLASILFLLVNVLPTPYASTVSRGCDGLHQMMAGIDHGDQNEYSEGYTTLGGAGEDLNDHSVPNADTAHDQAAIWEAAYALGNAKHPKNVPLTAEEQHTVQLGLTTCQDY